jgi:hypothetical protein
MSRRLYGCTAADVTTLQSGRVVPFSGDHTVWYDRENGTRALDLTDVDGTGVEVVTSDAAGQVAFYGPPGYEGPLWLDPGDGRARVLVRPVDIIGQSAYEAAVENGYEGTVQEWLDSLHAAEPNITTSATAVAPGGSPSATLSGEYPDLHIDFEVVTGQTGATGPAIGALLTAKGDLAGRDSSGAVRVPVGADGQVLQADSTAAAGVAWKPVGNLLTLNQASGTDALGDTTGFVAGAATVESSTEQAAQGSRSVKIITVANTGRATVGGTASAGTIPVEPGQTYTFQVSAKQTSGAALVGNARIMWWTSAGNVAASTALVDGSPVTLSSSWRELSVTGVAPANAAYASAFLTRYSGGESVMTRYEDKYTFHRGAGGTWALPGIPVTGLKPALTYAAPASAYTVSATDSVVAVDTTSGAVTVTLPPAADYTGQAIRIVKTGGAGLLTVTRSGSDTITPSSGSRTSVQFPAATHGEMLLVSSGTSWQVVSGTASDETVGRRKWEWSGALGASGTAALTGWDVTKSDTGQMDMRTVAMENGWTVAGTDMRLRRIGNLVTFRGTPDAAAATSDTFYTLPAGFRPPSSAVFGTATVATSAGATRLLEIGSNGVCKIYSRSTGIHWFNTTFDTNDPWPSTRPAPAAAIPTGV